MQFVNNGPDIPEALLEAHEEGRAVFFCGAGISYPAGLPDFKGLVDKIYEQLGTTLTEIEKNAYRRKQFDMSLDLLERRVPGERVAVRKELAKALEPKLRRQRATDTHAALLRLAHRRDGTLQLVTTNFDRVFERAAKRSEQPYRTYAAPTLPVPKVSRWNGLVHLHGLLPSKPDADESALDSLVVTSGDFGLAYLTERWAARFVSELFRNYVVCFIGYSINDLVLRYMMDALAADRRMLGEAMPQAYALGGCEPDQEETQAAEWKSKGVSPILYEVHQGANGHSALHQTLKVWSEIYRDGISGKKGIVARHAMGRPSASTQQDNFVGRMLWALSDRSGRPAKYFAEFNPAPSLEWLTAFSENRFQHADLSRFGISSRPPNTNLRFSLIRRPAPYQNASWMLPVGNKHDNDTVWDDVMKHLIHWLTRYLNDPRLIHWLIENGCQLHDEFSMMVESKMDNYEKLYREGKDQELDKIIAKSPHAIPDKSMRVIWRILLSGRVKSLPSHHDLYGWINRLGRDGLSASLRIQFRELLSPMIALRKPFRWCEEVAESSSARGLEKIVDWELVLAADHVQTAISDQSGEHWRCALPVLLDDLQQLLRDALDLVRELGKADDRRDGSFWSLPSIERHWQNRNDFDWVALIELLRDAWLAVREDNPAKAIWIAECWFELPYPTFKRLAFFAASQEDCIDSTLWSDWLLSDARWWLWSVETKREVMRLLALQGHRLASFQEPLEAAILDGPPRHMYQESLEPDDWKRIEGHSVWLRLAKLEESGLGLGKTARSRFDALSSANPSWKLLPYQREEFLFWMSNTGDPDYEENLTVDIAPRKRSDLVQWLKAYPRQQYPFNEDASWRDRCSTRFFHCFFALCDLTKDGVWPKVHWREALQAWREEDLVQRSWRYAAPLVRIMPDAILQDIAHSVAWWLKATSKTIDKHEDILLDLCQRILNLPIESDSGMSRNGEPIQRPVEEAINHPIGLVAESLLVLWFRREPNDNDHLPADIEPLLTQICVMQTKRFRHGRVMLASRLIALFRVDRLWTEQHLLPFFRWADNPVEAQAVWEGFLWSPRLYRPLLDAFEPQLLETASYYDNLCDCGQQYATFLTYAALESMDGGDPNNFRLTFEVLPSDGLQEAAITLSQALESVGEQREEYWTNRIRPFWEKIWPKSLDLVSGSIAELLILTSIAAGDKFPDAVDLFRGWLRPVEYSSRVVCRLQESGFCARFPDAALSVLDAIIQSRPKRLPELEQCLTAISQAMPDMQNDPRYRRLKEYAA